MDCQMSKSMRGSPYARYVGPTSCPALKVRWSSWESCTRLAFRIASLYAFPYRSHHSCVNTMSSYSPTLHFGPPWIHGQPYRQRSPHLPVPCLSALTSSPHHNHVSRPSDRGRSLTCQGMKLGQNEISKLLYKSGACRGYQ